MREVVLRLAKSDSWISALHASKRANVRMLDCRPTDGGSLTVLVEISAPGDHVTLVSKTNPNGIWDLGNGDVIKIVGKTRIIQGIRPGVVAFSLGHGHWAYGSRDIQVDGVTVKGDERRRKGFHANAVMLTDPYLPNTPLTDIVGGSAVFYDTNVNLVKVL